MPQFLDAIPHTCRHCGVPAVVQVRLDAGCLVFPDDREQWLCAQHWARCTPLGGYDDDPALD